MMFKGHLVAPNTSRNGSGKLRPVGSVLVLFVHTERMSETVRYIHSKSIEHWTTKCSSGT